MIVETWKRRKPDWRNIFFAIKLYCSCAGGHLFMLCYSIYVLSVICRNVGMSTLILPFLPRYQGVQPRGFVAMLSLPSATGMISVLEGASSQGLGVKTLYPALNQRSAGLSERPRLQSQSWMRRVCASGTVFVDSAHYWGSSEWGRTAPGCKSSPGSSS